MISTAFNDVQHCIATLKTEQTVAEENKLPQLELRSKIMNAEQELIKSTILFFRYLEENKIKF
jgi:hypothetical protein|tara:strand:+ start:478 stop:666 length:189 start_codon:yes stop_codon:yes gene_type:complete